MIVENALNRVGFAMIWGSRTKLLNTNFINVLNDFLIRSISNQLSPRLLVQHDSTLQLAALHVLEHTSDILDLFQTEWGRGYSLCHC